MNTVSYNLHNLLYGWYFLGHVKDHVLRTRTVQVKNGKDGNVEKGRRVNFKNGTMGNWLEVHPEGVKVWGRIKK